MYSKDTMHSRARVFKKIRVSNDVQNEQSAAGLGLIFALSASARGETHSLSLLLSGRVAFSYMGDIWTADDNGRTSSGSPCIARAISIRAFRRREVDRVFERSQRQPGCFHHPGQGGEAKQLTIIPPTTRARLDSGFAQQGSVAQIKGLYT